MFGPTFRAERAFAEHNVAAASADSALQIRAFVILTAEAWPKQILAWTHENPQFESFVLQSRQTVNALSFTTNGVKVFP